MFASCLPHSYAILLSSASARTVHVERGWGCSAAAGQPGTGTVYRFWVGSLVNDDLGARYAELC